MRMIGKSGATLSAAALTLAIAGGGLVINSAQAAEKVNCSGVNACKGQGACKTASSSCKGQNACKGQGWITTSAEQCKAWGGKIAS